MTVCLTEPNRAASARRPRGGRGFRVRLVVLLATLGLLVAVRVFAFDRYQVPTGSMAPALLGNHRECNCPRCGFPVQVGLHQRDNGSGVAQERWYGRAYCPNCGATDLGLHQAPVVAGQQLLVNKAAFVLRAPRRWEIVVFHLFGLDFIKRILGLPGETIDIRDGDLYVNDTLCRKTLAEFKAMRILVFDNNFQPQPMTWAARWECAPYRPDAPPAQDTAIVLDGTQKGAWHLAAYRHFCLDTNKWLSITDEYGYNGADPCRLVPVHDTMLECDVTVRDGEGALALGITDGRDHVVVQLPVRERAAPESNALTTVHLAPSFSLPVLADLGPAKVEATGVSLLPGKRYHVEWAFVDRRVSLEIDGVPVFAPLDLPAGDARKPLVRPMMLAVRGARATFTNIRLWRDVHYTEDGKQAVHGKVVHLGPDQYFVLGDNSPRSEDSRFWPDAGAVPGSAMVGAPLVLPAQK